MKGFALILVVLAAIGVALSAFTVSETEYALKFRLGKIIKTDYEAGLHWKMPFVNNVKKYDKRIIVLDASAERFITAEKKDVIVDSFVKWRINDVERFYTSFAGDMIVARDRLIPIIADNLKSEFAKSTLQEALSTKRDAIMLYVRESANDIVTPLGIEIVDVRIKQLNLPTEVKASVFNRMRSERKEVANELRSQGREEAEKIKANADREARINVANANSEALRIRGEGDAQAAKLYAEAYNQDREFYAFYRSLQAYRHSFTGGDDIMVLDANSDFFNYFDEKK